MTVHWVMEFHARSADRGRDTIALIKEGFEVARNAGADPAGFRLLQPISTASDGLEYTASIAFDSAAAFGAWNDMLPTNPAFPAWGAKLVDPASPCTMDARNLVRELPI